MTASGRPEAGEFADYAAEYIALVVGDDAAAALRAEKERVIAMLEELDDERIAGIRYAPGKWTLKEVLGHLIDDERIFAYRALCVARQEPLALPGFDEKLYVENAAFEKRSLASLRGEYAIVRDASIALFEALSSGQLLRRGMVNGHQASARGLAFHIAGHELHHLRIVESKYLPLVKR